MRRQWGLAVLLALAASAAAAGEPPPDAVLATLPFQPSPGPNQIVVDLAPPDSKLRMPLQLDTGASHSFLTPGFARGMGVKVSRVRSVEYRRATVLGRDLLFLVDTRRTDTAANQGDEFGLVGGDFLAQYVVELDFAAHRVRLLDPARFEVPSAAELRDEAVLPLEIVANRPAVSIVVNGKPYLVLLDTGATAGLFLSGETARAAGIASEPVAGLRFRGVLGPVDAEAARLARFEIGPFAFDDLPAVVSPNGFYNLGFSGDSLMGCDLLAQFTVRIDYPRRRLWLRRERSAPALLDPRKPEAAATMAWTIPPEPPDALDAVAPRSAAERQIWIEWKTPQPEQRVEGPPGSGWIAVEGWAGVGEPIEHDVVLVIDVSGSTAIASGVDVDGDGRVGRQLVSSGNPHSLMPYNPSLVSTDSGDTVLRAELTATKRLVELLDPDRTRIGLVAFSDGARILAPLGSDRTRIDQALHDIEEGFGSGATDMGRAISRGTEALLAGQKSTPAAPDVTKRRMTLLVLSDGWPTAPTSPEIAARTAIEAADAAAKHGIRVEAFGLGLASAGEHDVYARMASLTGGHFHGLPRPAMVIYELPKIALADVASVDLANLTTGAAGRAVRNRPDGSFDGFLLLAPGANRIRVEAHDDDGATRVEERAVFFDEHAPRSAGEAAAFDRRILDLRHALEQRRLETTLVNEIEAARKQRREVEVHPEPPPAP